MEYKVHISGLADGKYRYEFPIKDDFFITYANDSIKGADLVAFVELEKGSGWMNLTCNVKGEITSYCDRCLEELVLPFDVSSNIAVKHAKLGEKIESEDDFLILDHSEGELDLTQFLYDTICVNIPMKKIHKEGECNQQMISKLEQLNYSSSPLSQLKDMLKAKEK